jgi:type II secretory pathway pseudopilin PulG
MELKRGWAGFSLVEALIATAVLGFIAIGVLPMFTQAMVNNKQGSDSTVVTTFSKTNVEALDAVDFGAAPALKVVGGSSCVTVDWYVQRSAGNVGDGYWLVTYPTSYSAAAPCGPDPVPPQPVPTVAGLVLWKRTTTVTQYAADDVATSFSNPLPAGTSPDQVGLKKIQVVVQRAVPGGAVTAGKAITLQLLRSD